MQLLQPQRSVARNVTPGYHCWYHKYIKRKKRRFEVVLYFLQSPPFFFGDSFRFAALAP